MFFVIPIKFYLSIITIVLKLSLSYKFGNFWGKGMHEFLPKV